MRRLLILLLISSVLILDSCDGNRVGNSDFYIIKGEGSLYRLGYHESDWPSRLYMLVDVNLKESIKIQKVYWGRDYIYVTGYVNQNPMTPGAYVVHITHSDSNVRWVLSDIMDMDAFYGYIDSLEVSINDLEDSLICKR